MTWPFENDTSAVVKRLSNRNVAANRKRNIFTILTIALATALLSAIMLYGFGVPQETKNLNKNTAQIVFHAISEQQGQELYNQEEIAWVGEFSNAFSEQINHSTVNFTYANADMLKSQNMSYSGDLPTAEDEILVIFHVSFFHSTIKKHQNTLLAYSEDLQLQQLSILS